jgi:hypothetical protein
LIGSIGPAILAKAQHRVVLCGLEGCLDKVFAGYGQGPIRRAVDLWRSAKREMMMNNSDNLPIYENSFDKSQDNWIDEMRLDWVMEGKGIAECGAGHLALRSEIYTEPRDKDGHFNFWLKREFPANVAFEWEFRYPEPGHEGLAIVMWSAKGRNGENIFDSDLPPRKGEVMSDMHSGAINCYHTSYIARGRKIANLRKNYGFHLVTHGRDLSTVSMPDEWHVVRLEQCDGTIRLLFDGKESYQYFDDGSVGGPPIETGGMFGFRQQNNLYQGEYRNFKVYSLQ